ncbi:MAG: RidA family protein [Chloroflexia bacterium]|nr:RidA family protein [Chloroflexia bacterium]
MIDTGPEIRYRNPPTIPTPAGYSQVVEATGGRTVYVSGQVALDAENRLVGEGDFAAQARQCFENVRRALADAGLGFGHVVKLGLYVTDVAHLATLRAVRDEFVDTARPPASTLVQVAALFRPECLVEVEAIAVGLVSPTNPNPASAPSGEGARS